MEWTSLEEIAIAVRCVNLVDYIFYSSYKDQSRPLCRARRKSRLDQIHREQILISGNKSSTPITRSRCRNKENRDYWPRRRILGQKTAAATTDAAPFCFFAAAPAPLLRSLTHTQQISKLISNLAQSESTGERGVPFIKRLFCVVVPCLISLSLIQSRVPLTNLNTG